MMNGADSFLEELARLIHLARQEYEGYQAQASEALGKLKALEVTERLYRESHRLPEPRTAADDLRGLTQLQALFKIAQMNGGHFKVQEARRLMTQAGLLKSKKNASSILYTLIARSGMFVRVAPGEYRIDTEEGVPIRTP
jgi:hypothetical protein